jgi:spermidine/putrescine transport system permease protein
MSSLTEAPAQTTERAERRRATPIIATLPAVAWLLAFFAAPLLVFLVYSFLTNELYAVGLPFTLEAYADALTSSLNRTLARNSLVVGLLTAATTVIVGLPIAYWLRFVARRSRLAVLFLITASMFASYLVRIYAWRTVLGSRGLVNSSLERAGLIDEPLGFLLYSRFAVVVALVHIFLPYVVLVLFAGMGPVSDGLLESARDLGANASLLWRRVLLPIMAAPAFSAFVFVFILSSADYVTPQFLGGKDGVTLGVQIQQNFIADGTWPLAAATSFLMLLAFVAVYAIGAFALRRMRLNDIKLES